MTRTLVCFLIGTSLLFSGCNVIMQGVMEAGSNRGKCWRYKPGIYNGSTMLFNKTAVVLPFQDKRKETVQSGNMLLCLITPVVNVACSSVKQRPEALSIAAGFNPREDFAKALAEELQSSNMFREAYFDEIPDNGNYVISGTILETIKDDTIYSYGLSFLSVPLWFVGLPAGSVVNSFSVDIISTEARTGRIVLAKTYTAPQSHELGWVYAAPKECNYSEMAQTVYRQFVTDLTQKLVAEQPETSLPLSGGP